MGSASQRRKRRQRLTGQTTQRQEKYNCQMGTRPSGPYAGGGDIELAAELTANLSSAGPEPLDKALARLREPGVARRLAFEPAGCRTLQLALDNLDRRAGAEVAEALKGQVIEAIRSPHANYVVQKIIKVLTPEEAPFVVQEVSQASWDLARHEYGCRIYCRLLEHAASEQSTSRLIDSVLGETEELLRHTFGHHVVECALEHGLPHQRKMIIDAIRRSPLRNAWNRNAAYVVEKALMYGNEEDRNNLAMDLLANPASDIAALARSQYGSMVVRAILRMSEPIATKAQECIRNPASLIQLKATKHGRRLLEDQGIVYEALPQQLTMTSVGGTSEAAARAGA